MKHLRSLLSGLDPWTALLLGSVVTLTLVILLALPGPWQKVVGLAQRNPKATDPQDDVAVFVLGRTEGRCSGIVWVHIDPERTRLTATVLPPETVAFVAGGGCVPLNRIVDDLGPQAAANGLAEVLGVELDAWVTLDREAMRLAVPTMFGGGLERPRRDLYLSAARAWDGRMDLAEAWPEQYQTLGLALPQVAFDQINVVAFANYLLGFGIMQSEFDLQATTAIGDMLRTLTSEDVRVRALPAITQVSGAGREWTLQQAPLNDLRHSLQVGLIPTSTLPQTVVRKRAASVLVVTPDGAVDGGTYSRVVRRELARRASAPVRVSLVAASPANLTKRVKAAVAAQRPLVVLVAPPRSDGQTAVTAAALTKLGKALRQMGQPAVISLPLGVWSPMLDDASGYSQVCEAIKATGVPVSRISASLVPNQGTRAARSRLAARANVETLIHTCWAATLAPQLASIKLGFSLAAAQAVPVRVVAPSMAAAERAAARLRLWGYDAQAVEPGTWKPDGPHPERQALYYHTGMLRAARALGGDLGVRPGRLLLDDAGPAELTLVLAGAFAPLPPSVPPSASPSPSPPSAPSPSPPA